MSFLTKKHIYKSEYPLSPKSNLIENRIQSQFLSGSNLRYQKMYDWMSYGYDIVEKFIGKIKYGNSIQNTREELMQKLEWSDYAKVLYVSIGTGTNLDFIPEHINKHTLKIVGIDISLGMLKICQKKYANRCNLTLLQCCAEALPFEDNFFDTVFHVGGINFFNDKQSAFAEMLRVAKAGCKILIADETKDLLKQQYRKSIWTGNYFKNETINLTKILACIPPNVKEQKIQMLWERKFYCITFKK